MALTFDDGPDPLWTPRVLEALDAAGARATFFVIVPRARRAAGLLREMLARGHEVALHCTEHVRHTETSRERVVRDTAEGLAGLRDLGVEPALWRPPWGALAPWTREVAEGFGLALCLWSADTHDWRGDPARRMLLEVAPALRPGAVVLMHDGLGPGARRSGCRQTVELVAPLVARIRAAGCEPAPAGEIAAKGRLR
ncbi:polysaccharide deacetylase [Rubrobacter xylanophilus DSM 9941]|uniref:Polysaccharide deacetylase n=1 Tax=Rubrobacter xylanophilus (strain DSM 9941 / JCM 11954 / NBRC 16129 / PRD-1) TaxID=266117 RepID=Q1AWB8_RUBXD|nr:polysaccharide deacetylase [Rubrobacter xylanophilus DSM 9941]